MMALIIKYKLCRDIFFTLFQSTFLIDMAVNIKDDTGICVVS